MFVFRIGLAHCCPSHFINAFFYLTVRKTGLKTNAFYHINEFQSMFSQLGFDIANGLIDVDHMDSTDPTILIFPYSKSTTIDIWDRWSG
ncbi:MAG: hypothetical protein IPH78_14780 [Bacteroidetes bacterium]|nr:hypothetical protein [Bacteroidota bacterium]